MLSINESGSAMKRNGAPDIHRQTKETDESESDTHDPVDTQSRVFCRPLLLE
jgi:hypothetical protein